MSKLRILTVSDSVEAPTGFGRQHQVMADALAATGKYDVVSIGLWHNGRAKQREVWGPAPAGDICLRPHTPLSYWCYPAGDLEAEWPQIVQAWGPDIVIALGDLWMFECISDMPKRSFDWIHWLPIDAEPYAKQYDGILRKMDHLVLMSQFGEKLVRPHVESRVRMSNIGHGIDPAVFCPVTPEEKLALRRLWGIHLNFDLSKAKTVLICHDTNQWRKNTPELLRMMQHLPMDTVLILHCTETPVDGSGGWDLSMLAKDFGVDGRVVITGKGTARLQLSEAELASLIQACDIRVSATTGEGFGICSIEAAACGVPTVITNCTTSEEIIGGDPPCGLLAKVAGFYTQSGAPFQRALVDAQDMAGGVHALSDDALFYKSCAEAGIARVRERYTTEIIGRQWVELVDRHVASR